MPWVLRGEDLARGNNLVVEMMRMNLKVVVND